jgi:UTP-glucose-1-phosphate uridylyltransferase
VLSDIRRHDTGNPLGWLTAVIDLALDNPDIAPALRSWLDGRLQAG